ncbi:depupylase/deamidase Dop, partial [Corynebacterium stationis]|uniref:depupylase/deamidase Dop n=1 Tax=Corynebacterium stationis TaxID=1705 RepID=UPI002614066E
LDAAAAVASLTAEGKSVLANNEPCPPLKLYKNNVDGKGASYGSHENYQYSRDTDFDVLAQALIPFFVARIVVTGAGRVGLEQDGSEPGFQISQRADYMEQEITLETTLNRGIINTRDEPHADAEHWGRLHVIVGDANMSQTSNLLKLGMTSMVLDAIEQGVDFSDLKLANPVAEIKNVSRDLSLQHKLKLKDGRELSALDILTIYRERVTPASEVDTKVLEAWDEVVALLVDDPLSAAHLLDWVAKYRLIKGFTNRGIALDDPKLALIDLQYTDIDPAKSLYHALVRKRQMRTLVSQEEIEAAKTTPPHDTRAYFRGRVTEKFGEDVLATNWQVMSVQEHQVTQGTDTTAHLAHIRLDDVGSFNHQAVGEIIDASSTVSGLVKKLEEQGIGIQRTAKPIKVRR